MKKLADVFIEQNKVLKELKGELANIHNKLDTTNTNLTGVVETQNKILGGLTTGLANIHGDLVGIKDQLATIKRLCCCSKGAGQETPSSPNIDNTTNNPDGDNPNTFGPLLNVKEKHHPKK